MALRSSGSSGFKFSLPSFKGSAEGGGSKVKLIVAGICLLVACVLLADNFGVINIFGGGPAPIKLTPEQEGHIAAGQAANDALAKKLLANPNIKKMGDPVTPPQ